MFSSSFLTFAMLTLHWQVTSLGASVVDISNATKSDPIKINCTGASDNETVTWTYEDLSLNRRVVPTNNFTLSIFSSEDVGNYSCSYANPATLIDWFQAINFSSPVIPHTGRSITFIQGRVNQTIDCYSYSYPPPEFVWTVLDYMVTNATTKRQEFSVSKLNFGSRLTISSVSYSNRGWYNCTASNDASSEMTPVFVRVHNHLAPLWPFFGIVAEVILIGLMIYLIRRNAALKSKELGAPFQESTNSSESSRESEEPTVRYRTSVRS